MSPPAPPTPRAVWLRFAASLLALAAGTAAIILVVLLARDTLG
jgi:hypothetical protein